MDGLKQEEEKEHFEKAKKQWEEKSSKRPVLNEKSSGEELQEEAEWIQRNFVNNLNRCCKKVTVCAISKRWWMVEHQQKTFLSGRNDCVRVDALCQSYQRHPGGGILCGRRQYDASRCITPADRSFTVSSRSVGLVF